MIPIDKRNEALRRKNTLLLGGLLGNDSGLISRLLTVATYRERPRRFTHGLGDAVNAATLWFALGQLRDMKFSVDCQTAFAPIFQAAGVRVATGSGTICPWEHPSYNGSIHPVWVDNKTAFNCPIPVTQDVWDAICSVKLRLCFPKQEQVVNEWLSNLKRPIIVLHTRGATSGIYKDFPVQLEQEFFEAFEQNMPGTLVWLSGTPDKFKRVVPFQYRGLPYLYSLLSAANLVIGIDSGPLHLTRWTDTPGLGCWFSLHPTAFVIPSQRIRHLVATEPQVPNQYGSHARYAAALLSRIQPFNLVPVPRMTVETIIHETNRILH